MANTIGVKLRLNTKEALSDFEKQMYQTLNRIEKQAEEIDPASGINKSVQKVRTEVAAVVSDINKKIDQIAQDSQLGKDIEKQFISLQTSVDKQITAMSKSIGKLQTALNRTNSKELSEQIKSQFNSIKETMTETYSVMKNVFDLVSPSGYNFSLDFDTNNTVKELNEIYNTLQKIMRGYNAYDSGAAFQDSTEKIINRMNSYYKTFLKLEDDTVSLEESMSRMQEGTQAFDLAQQKLEAMELSAQYLASSMGNLFLILSERKVDFSGLDKEAYDFAKNFSKNVDGAFDEIFNDTQEMAKNIESQLKEINGDLLTVDTFQIKDGAIQVPVKIAENNEVLRSQLSNLINKLQNNANDTPIKLQTQLAKSLTTDTNFVREAVRKLNLELRTGKVVVHPSFEFYKKDLTKLQQAVNEFGGQLTIDFSSIFNTNEEYFNKLFGTSKINTWKNSITTAISEVKTSITEMDNADNFMSWYNVVTNGLNKISHLIDTELSSKLRYSFSPSHIIKWETSVLQNIQNVTTALNSIDFSKLSKQDISANINIGNLTELKNNLESISKLNNGVIDNVKADIQQLTQALTVLSTTGVNINSVDALNNITPIVENLISSFNDLPVSINRVSEALDKISNNNNVNNGFNRIIVQLQNLADMFQRVTGAASNFDIKEDFFRLKSLFNSIADDKGAINLKTQKKELQEFISLYQKYIDIGGKQGFSSFTDNKKTIGKLEKLWNNYETESPKVLDTNAKIQEESFNNLTNAIISSSQAENELSNKAKEVTASLEAENQQVEKLVNNLSALAVKNKEVGIIKKDTNKTTTKNADGEKNNSATNESIKEEKELNDLYNKQLRDYLKLQKLKQQSLKATKPQQELQYKATLAEEDFKKSSETYKKYADELTEAGILLDLIKNKEAEFNEEITRQEGLLDKIKIDIKSKTGTEQLKQKLKQLTELQKQLYSLEFKQTQAKDNGETDIYSQDISRINNDINALIVSITNLKKTEQDELLISKQKSNSQIQRLKLEEKFNATIQRQNNLKQSKILKQEKSDYDNISKSLEQSVAHYTGYALGISKMVSSVRSGIGYLKQFDKALTTITYTMDISQNKIEQMGEGVIDLAKQLKTSTDNAFNVAQIYANMNTTVEDIMKTSQPTLILSNLTGVDASTSADQIQAVMQQFEKTAEESQHIVDVYDYISKQIAVDYSKGIQGMSEAVEVAGATASAAGLSFEQLSAITAKTIETTRQAGSQVGNGLKTIFTRLSKANKISDEEIDNETLSNASKALSEIGVQVYKANGEYRQFDVIMGELASKWDSLTDAQRANISYNVAATRQTNLLSAVLKTYSSSMQLAEEATLSEGNALANQQKYMESYTGKMQGLSTTWETIWIHLFDSEGFKDIISDLTTILEVIDNIVTGVGSIPSMISLLSFGASNALISSLSRHGFNLSEMIFSKDEKIKVERGKTELELILGEGFEDVSDLLVGEGEKTDKYISGKMQKFKTLFQGLGQSIKSAFINIGISAGISLVAAGISWLVSNIINYRNEMRSIAREINETFKTNVSTLDSYSSKIIEINAVLDNQDSTVEELAEAHLELNNIQTEIIKKYGDEANAIDLTTGSIEKQIEALNELKKYEFEEAKRQFNAKSGGLKNFFIGMASNFVDFYKESVINYLSSGKEIDTFDVSKFLFSQFGQTGYEKQLDEYINYKVKFTAIDKNTQLFLENQGFDNTTGFIYEFNGNAEEVSELLSKMSKEAESLELNKTFQNNLSKAQQDAQALVDDFGTIANQDYYYNTIEPDINLKSQADSIATLYQQYQNASTASSKEIALNDLRDRLSEVLKDADEELSNWYESMYSGVITVPIKIAPYLDMQVSGSQATYKETLDYVAKTFNDNFYGSDYLSDIAKTLVTDADIESLNTSIEEPFKKLKQISDETKISISELIYYLSSTGLILSEQELEIKMQFPKEFSEYQKWSSEVKEIALSTSWDGKSWEDWNRDIDEQLKQGIIERNKGFSSSSMIKELSDVSETFLKIDDAYAEFFDKNNAVEGIGLDKMNGLINQLEKIQGFELGSVEDEITTLTNAKSIDEAQKAFNNLATAVVKNSNVLKNVNEKTKDNTIATLKNMGIKNAAEVVEQSLARAQQELAAEEELLIKEKLTVSEATIEQINAFNEESASSEETRQALARLKLAEIDVNNIDINTKNDVDNLRKLAETAGLARVELEKLETTADVYAKYGQKVNSILENGKRKILSNAGGTGIQVNTFEDDTLKQWNNALADRDKELKEILDGINWDNTELELDLDYGGGSTTADKIKSANESASESEKLIDWIEIKIKRVQEAVTRLGKIVSATYKDWSTRSKGITDEQAKLREEIELQTLAAQKYRDEAEKIVLPENYKKLVREGGLNAELITDKTLQKHIDEYQELIDKAIAAEDSVEDLVSNIYSLISDKISQIQSKFDGVLSFVEHRVNEINSQMDKVNTLNKIAGKSFYNALIEQTQSKIKSLESQYAEINAEMANIPYGTELWYQHAKELQSVEESIWEANNAIVEYQQNLKQVAKQDFDDLANQFSNALGLVTDKINLTDKVVSLVENTGHIVNQAYYKSMRDSAEAQISVLSKEYETLSNRLAQAMSEGDIRLYSEEWYEMNSQINEVQSSIIDLTSSVVEYQNALRDIDWDLFDRMQDSLKNLTGESDFFIDLLKYEDLFKDGSITDAGLATQGLYVQNYQTYMEASKKYANEILKIQDELAKDPGNITLISRLAQLNDQQHSVILSAYQMKESLKDLAQDGFDDLLDRIRELINEYKNSLSAAQDLYNYEKNIREKTDTINSLQKQIYAYSGDNSEETRATLQKLNSELKKAQEDLAETEQERMISDIENALDTFLSDLEDWWDNRLQNIEDILANAVEQTNLNSQKIWDKIQAESSANSDIITKEMQNVWTMTDNHMSATDDILNSTSDTCNQIESDIQLLPTQDGLENYLSGQNLMIVSSIYGVENAVNRVDSSIGAMTNAVNQIASKVTEYNASVLRAIASASAAAEAAQQAANAAAQAKSSGSSGSSGSNSGGTINSTSNLDKGSQSSNGFMVINGLGQVVATAPTAAQASQQANVYKNNLKNTNGMPSDVLEQLKKISIVKYAKGGIVGKDDNPFDYIAQSLGEDHMVAAKEGERVLTEQQNKNFEKLVNNLTILSPEALERFNSVSQALAKGRSYNMSNINPVASVGLPNTENNTTYGNINTDVGGITLNLPNVTNKDEFIGWLKNDSQIENIIQSMTVSRMLGKNSYAKMKY